MSEKQSSSVHREPAKQLHLLWQGLQTAHRYLNGHVASQPPHSQLLAMGCGHVDRFLWPVRGK